MKILNFTLCLFVLFIFSTVSFAQPIRHSYAELNPPINDDFPFDAGIIDLDKLNPVNFLKDKVSRDTVQAWNKITKSWYADGIFKNNFSPKCGNIKSRLDYKIDSLNREILVNADTFLYDKNLLKSIQNFEYINNVKVLYEQTQFIFKSNQIAPDTVLVTQGDVKRRITYTFSNLRPILIKDEVIGDSQQVKSQLQYKLTYDKGFLISYVKERKMSETWKVETISIYKYNDLGLLISQSNSNSLDNFEDTVRYAYTYNSVNYLVQLETYNVKSGISKALTYKYTNFNSSGFAINVDIFAFGNVPFVKYVYENLIDDGKIRLWTVQSVDSSGKFGNVYRLRTVFCGDPGDGNGTTPVSDFNNFGAKIFPNPAQNFIQFDAATLENTPLSATIYDLYGRLVLQAKDKNAGELIDISGLANGAYILKLASVKQMSVVPFVVQR